MLGVETNCDIKVLWTSRTVEGTRLHSLSKSQDLVNLTINHYFRDKFKRSGGFAPCRGCDPSLRPTPDGPSSPPPGAGAPCTPACVWPGARLKSGSWIKVLPSWLQRSVCLPFTRLEHRSEELSLVIDICDPRTYPVLLTNQEPRWRYHLDFQCLVLRDAWLAQHLREKDHRDTAKFGDIIFNFRFVIKWLLNNLFIFLCSGQLTRSLCGLNYSSTNVDGRVAICPCL